MTRVLCLTSWYPPHHFGGYEVSCFDVMTRLVPRGHHVEVLCSDEELPGVGAPDEVHERRVHRTLRLYHRDGDLWSPTARERLAIERHNQRALAEALSSCRPDVVSVWHVGAMSLGLVTELIERRVPIVYCVSDMWPAYAVKLDAWLRMFAWCRPVGALVGRLTGVPSVVPALDSSGGACFISQLTRSQVREGSRWDFPCSAVVYSGVDRQLFRPPPVPRERRWRGRLLYVGRLDPRKGLDTALRAVAAAPGTTLTVDGRGSAEQRRHLEALIADLGVGDRVEFTESDRSDLPGVYAAADACVFPSEWEEPFGLVPLEAMACAVPVVVTGTGGSGEYLVDGFNCLRFGPGDPAALAGALARLSEDPALRDRLVSVGLETAEFFDADRITDAFEAWHAAAVAGFPDGPLPDRAPPSASSRPG